MKTRNKHRKEKKKEKGKHRKTIRGGANCKTYKDIHEGNCLIGQKGKNSHGSTNSMPNFTSKINNLEMSKIINQIEITTKGDDISGGNTFYKFIYFINDRQLVKVFNDEDLNLEKL